MFPHTEPASPGAGQRRGPERFGPEFGQGWLLMPSDLKSAWDLGKGDPSVRLGAMAVEALGFAAPSPLLS